MPFKDAARKREYQKNYYRSRLCSDAEFKARHAGFVKRADPKKRRAQRILLAYGVTQADYERLLSKQNSRCAICETTNPGRGHKHFCIDHNHTTGAIRGLLCSSCNKGLGFFKDRPKVLRLAIRYLRKDARSARMTTASK